jgi:hypothetical protein
VCLEYVLNETGLLVVGRLETLYKVTFMNREKKCSLSLCLIKDYSVKTCGREVEV